MMKNKERREFGPNSLSVTLGGRLNLKATAKRLYISAQGWLEATTLGTNGEKTFRKPDGVAGIVNRTVTQRSRFAATLGYISQPLRGWCLVMVLACLSASAFAQTRTAGTGITVRVTDQQGAVVHKASVTLHTRDNGVRIKGLTNERGTFLFEQLAPGEYLIEAEAEGFARAPAPSYACRAQCYDDAGDFIAARGDK